MEREKLGRYLAAKPNILFAFLFGSWARGDAREDSDVDIAVYLKDRDYDILEYLDWKRDLEEICGRTVDLAILNDATPLLKYQVYLDGVLLFSKDDILASNFLVRALFEYEDMRPYLELTYKRMIDRVRQEVKGNGET
ncbi:nucleotidyltransferase domain-containing protein [Carboxydocella sp. JDF658]|uniref:type VII toxin-antitoxin system MntA family adenylyltransferase antitoxin n=1 Tax=Carboxydocella sp. JDF658 TaxID=1926600 RepID=UPI0009C89ADA|nr:nucleotidyltransferase domain-containing protein [Carboxydocella sp. JDF658]GAW31731.1 DNA polymerase beta [Carboxydocella sp. JDF658]